MILHWHPHKTQRPPIKSVLPRAIRRERGRRVMRVTCASVTSCTREGMPDHGFCEIGRRCGPAASPCQVPGRPLIRYPSIMGV
jgi:hypothetical protein